MEQIIIHAEGGIIGEDGECEERKKKDESDANEKQI